VKVDEMDDALSHVGLLENTHKFFCRNTWKN